MIAVDFEKSWLEKFASCLYMVAGAEMRDEIMAGCEGLSDDAGREAIVEWTKKAMVRLEERVGENDRIEIMTGCSCQYPKADLEDVRLKYEETEDVDVVLDMLQNKFLSFLENDLNLDAELVSNIVERGWGLAGRREGRKIIATKIPKSAYILRYMKESDPVKKRAIYCHCPRIRDSFKSDVSISPTYCYCGAGYYKGIWEEILQRPVKVELLESVLKGDDVCKVAVHLP